MTTQITRKQAKDSLRIAAPRGFLINGKIVPSVASNNLTVAIKTLSGDDPTPQDPVIVRIGDTLREITAALSVTKAAGTNWFNAGSSELATKEIDYFVYLGYNATDGVVIGFSRIIGTEYDSFSTTTTNEKYCAISTITNAAAGDDYELIGRFAATLSAGAGYTWTVPTFTNKNLIQYPIFESRWLNWQPTYSASGSMTYTSVTTTLAEYQVRYDEIRLRFYFTGTTGGTANTDVYATMPFTADSLLYATGGRIQDGGATIGYVGLNSTTQLAFRKYDISNWGLGAGRIACSSSMMYGY